MPTPRAHGGAPLAPINLASPASMGLNTADESSPLGPEWATTLDNAVFDRQGRPSTRNGFVSGTTTVYDGTEKKIQRIFEYWKADGTSEIISSTDDNILTGLVDLSDTTASIDGSLSISDGNIKFVNFNNKCIAFGIGASSVPAVYTGTGNFTSITVNSGTAPTGSIGHSAFGRLWVTDADGFTVRFSALLDETRWAGVDGGGSMDFSQVWPQGQDTVVAISELGGRLVVFGKNNIIVLNDGTPSTLGLSTDDMFVEDTIPGVGCISQFGVIGAAGDLWFVAPQGVTSLGRALVQASTPLERISANVRSDILTALANEANEDDITLVSSPLEGFVLAIFPSSSETWAFDTRRGPIEDGSHRATHWSVALQTAAYIVGDRSIRASLSVEGGGSTTGEIYNYSGFSDDGISYNFTYKSGWLDLGEQGAAYLKFVKKMVSVVFVAADTTVNHTLDFDFAQNTSVTIPVTAEGSVPGSEYNICEYGTNGSRDPADGSLVAGTDVSEYAGGSLTLHSLSAPGIGGGQYIKVGINTDNNDAEFSLQSLNLFAKIGRLAT